MEHRLFEMDVTVQCSKISDDQTIGLSWLHMQGKCLATVRFVSCDSDPFDP